MSKHVNSSTFHFYLIKLLEEEFGDNKTIRIKPVFPTSTQRSLDLEQNYNEEESNLHRTSGVNVFTERRQYFFPTDWVATKNYKAIEELINEIKNG